MLLRKKTKDLYKAWLYKLVNGNDGSCIIVNKKQLKTFLKVLKKEVDKGGVLW